MKAKTDFFDWLTTRYHVRLLIRAMGRIHEVVKYSLVRPERNCCFHIVSSERHAGPSALNCLQSVYDQSYPNCNIRHVFIDDASEDDTGANVRKWLDGHPNHQTEFIENPTRVGAFANNLRGFRMARPGEVVLELNGDDWLPDAGVLSFLNKVYSDPDVWTTFNTFRQIDGVFPITLGPTREIINSGRIRQVPWATSHLHSFRSELFHRIDPAAFVNPATGALWESAHDQATYLPMIELAGTHARHIYRTTYAYNLHEMNDQVLDRSTQVNAASAIRSLPPQKPLDTLAHHNPLTDSDDDYDSRALSK